MKQDGCIRQNTAGEKVESEGVVREEGSRMSGKWDLGRVWANTDFCRQTGDMGEKGMVRRGETAFYHSSSLIFVNNLG